MTIKKIVALIKQVPNTNEIKIDPKTGTLIRDGIPSIMNPDDKHALEQALVLKDQTVKPIVCSIILSTITRPYQPRSLWS